MYVRESGRQAKICDFPQKILKTSSGLPVPHTGMLFEARQGSGEVYPVSVL
jgi:hypothetical protein